MTDISPLVAGYVKGRFLDIVGDTSIDVDHEPDAPPLSGTVTLTPEIAWVLVAAGSPVPVTYMMSPIQGTLDADGYLCDATGQKYLGVVGSDSPNANPTGFTYKVTHNLRTPSGKPFVKPSYSILVPTGTSAAALDLTLASPVAASSGVPTVVGPTGPAGSSWLTGAGAPSNGAGVVNDFYLNATNGDYYKKTGVSTWALQGNLKGTAGTNGARGSKWFIGHGAPGSIGGSLPDDQYLDIDTGDVYTLS